MSNKTTNIFYCIQEKIQPKDNGQGTGDLIVTTWIIAYKYKTRHKRQGTTFL